MSQISSTTDSTPDLSDGAVNVYESVGYLNEIVIVIVIIGITRRILLYSCS